MKIVEKIRVERFRSIRDSSLDNLGEFCALAGLNNSGKSNFLRALNAFFTDEVDSETKIDVARDYYRPDLRKKKKKIIKVSVEFDLPDRFTFHSKLKPSEDFLTRSFAITKEWDIWSEEPTIYINYDNQPLEPEEVWKVDNFLSLINFRYIANRVLPVDVIRKEQSALRDVLIRRLARHKDAAEQLLGGISDVGQIIISEVSTTLENTFQISRE